jgi:tRNA (guanine37-N1)-methyltransferase
MRFDVLTMLPEIFTGYVSQPVLRRAREQELVGVYLHNFSDCALSRGDLVVRRKGIGKQLKPRPIVECLSRVRTLDETPGHVIMLSPQGRGFNQSVAEELVGHERLILLCGRFAGFDPRVREELQPDEVSVGDFILLGGEVAALVIVDTIIRLVPGVLGGA